MTLPQVYRIFEYWKRSPPEHEMLNMLARCFTTWRPPETVEEQHASGAMNAAEFLDHFKRTGGKVPGMSPVPGM